MKEEVKYKTVSVVMCTYNGETYLREQLESIINQSYPVDEFIIQDDDSTDNTWNILQKYASQYPFIKLYRNTERLGYNHNFLSALFKAKSDVVALADQDDIWHKEKIRRQVNKLNEGFLLVFHNSALFKDSPENIISKRYNELPVISELRLALKPFIPGHECLFARNIFPVIRLMYEQENSISFDSIVALTCVTLGRVAYLDECLVFWRRHIKATTYVEKSRPEGRVAGMLRSFSSLSKVENKTIINRYFRIVGALPFQTVAMQKVACLLQHGSWSFIRACVICCRCSSLLFSNSSLSNKIKATFTPLHLLRDGTFLIK